MNHSASVFRTQRRMFISDKGMLVFYLAGIVISGVAVPFFSHSLVSSFSTAVFFTTMFLKPMLAESLAGERDKRTLESLLSTPVGGKSVLWGKLLFHLLFALILFGASAACAAITCKLAGYEPEFAPWQWLCVAVVAAVGFTAIAASGTYLSAISADMRTANGKVPMAAYPLGLVLIVFFSVVALDEPIVTLIIGGVAAVIYLCVAAAFCVKASVMAQHKYFENIKARKYKRAREGQISSAAPKSQFATVLRHEWRYLRTIKSQLRLFAFFCFVPVFSACLMKFGSGKIFGLGYLDLTVILTVLFVPSAIKNMISYSIGGERAYKTGESLLSTPLDIKMIFLAKCALPFIFAITIIASASLLTLTGVNVVNRFVGSGVIELYSAVQLTLLVPGGIMACIAMIFINGILSVLMKLPRNGLYVSTLVSLILFAPPAMIVYGAPANALMLAVIYAAVLLLINAVIWVRISGNIRHPWLMSRM